MRQGADFKGYLALILHAHLPFVRHPEHERFLEEQWFFEAVTETYIPLIAVFEKLGVEGVDFRMTMSLSPPLVSMLTDELLQERYLHHLDRLIELAEKEIERTKRRPEFMRLAEMYHLRFTHAREMFENRYGRNLAAAFRGFQDAGKLEIMACAATHGFLPVLSDSQSAVRAQVEVGAAHYEKYFGRRPAGMWLPECGYYTGLDKILKESAIEYFVLEAHGIINASPRPANGVFEPVRCPSGVAAFGRDMESSRQVWSATEGYPGDFSYRDFFRDIGFDLELDDVRPYIQPGDVRVFTGMKYHRITGKTGEKLPYDPDLALERAAEHSADFLAARIRQVHRLAPMMDRKPVVVAPYDAELFGHWWFEGPGWIYCLLKKMHFEQDSLRLITPTEYLRENSPGPACAPSPSSWGHKGYSEVWLSSDNDWIYRHLHRAADRMAELARTHPCPDDLTRRALNQAARELLLAQSSDWAFMIKAGATDSYARKRTTDHLLRFTLLYHEILDGRIGENGLARLETLDNIFPDIDYAVYA